MFERSLEEEKVSCKVVSFTSINALRRCVELGVGITVAPLVAVQDLIEQHRLTRVDIPLPETPVLMIHHTDKWCSPLLKRFMAMVDNLVISIGQGGMDKPDQSSP